MKILKRFAFFLLIWFSIQSTFHFISDKSSNFGIWILILLLLYIWKVKKLQKSLWWKMGHGVLVWIIGSIFGSIIGAVLFSSQVVGMIFITLLFLLIPIYE